MNKIKNRWKRRKQNFPILLLGIILSTLFFNFLNGNIPFDKVDNELNGYSNLSPKSSAPEINITTPENKTYGTPMSGYYPGTFSFDEDEENAIHARNWTGEDQASIWSKIENEKDGHYKVYRMYDSTASDYAGIRNRFDSQNSGTVEFWWYKDQDTMVAGYIRLINMTSSLTALEIMAPQDATANWNYADDSGGNTLPFIRFEANKWYHFRIDFECSNGFYTGLAKDTFRISCEGTSAIGNLFSNKFSVNHFELRTRWGGGTHNYWTDAVGYSWDPNYDIGNNLKEGLLLSFNNYTNLDWMGYSLDGQANKTIFGNTTIPMPSNGLHSIQVFGNDTYGKIYQSYLRNFTINVDISTGTDDDIPSDKWSILIFFFENYILIMIILGAIVVGVPTTYIITSKKKKKKVEVLKKGKSVRYGMDFKENNLNKREELLRRTWMSEDLSGRLPGNGKAAKGFVDTILLLKILNDEKGLEKLKLFKNIKLTTISDETWKKLEQLNLPDVDFKELVKDLLTLTPRERDEIIDGMLDLKNSEQQNGDF